MALGGPEDRSKGTKSYLTPDWAAIVGRVHPHTVTFLPGDSKVVSVRTVKNKIATNLKSGSKRNSNQSLQEQIDSPS